MEGDQLQKKQVLLQKVIGGAGGNCLTWSPNPPNSAGPAFQKEGIDPIELLYVLLPFIEFEMAHFCVLCCDAIDKSE